MIKMGLKPLATTCPQCTVAKIHRFSYTSSDRVTTRPGEIIGVDLIGPMEVPSFGKGYKFAVLIVDKHTDFRFVRFTNAKSATNVVIILNEFCLEWKGLQGDSPYCFDLSELISDNGSEFSRFPEYCNAKGIRYMHSAPYTPEQNGLAERAVRSTIEGTRALRAGTNLKKSVWAEMMSTYVHLSNLQPRQFNPSPYTMLFGRNPTSSTSVPSDVSPMYTSPTPCAPSWTTRRGRASFWATTVSTPRATVSWTLLRVGLATRHQCGSTSLCSPSLVWIHLQRMPSKIKRSWTSRQWGSSSSLRRSRSSHLTYQSQEGMLTLMHPSSATTRMLRQVMMHNQQVRRSTSSSTMLARWTTKEFSSTAACYVPVGNLPSSVKLSRPSTPR